MDNRTAVVFSVLVGGCCLKSLQFPAGFKFGAASSAYQVEGAWNVSDKSPSVWDVYSHKKNNSTGDVACDSYRLWRRDIEMAAELGLGFYRFSISWSRLLPNGFSNYISEDGKNYYNNLIDGLLERGIEACCNVVPLGSATGGWTNPLITDWFADYAKVAYLLFGSRVKTWLTMNEPTILCNAAFIMDFFDNVIIDRGEANHICHKHTMIAHAKAWRIYDEEFKPKFHGAVSIAINFFWLEPKGDEDIELTKLAKEYNFGLSADPIFSKSGGWPPFIEAIIANRSLNEGRHRSKMPSFTEEEIELVKGTYDFMAVNYYFARQVRRRQPGEELISWPVSNMLEIDVVLEMDKWPKVYKLMPIYPEGFRYVLREIKQKYGDIKILITENGYADYNVGLDDDNRVKYFRDFLEQMLLAINEDGVNIVGYTAWSLMDTYEWFSGYTLKFGLYEVNFTDPQVTRTPRKSALYYANIIKTNSLDVK